MTKSSCSKCGKTIGQLSTCDNKWYCPDHLGEAKRKSNEKYERLRVLREYVLPIVGTLAAITAAVFGILAYLGSLD